MIAGLERYRSAVPTTLMFPRRTKILTSKSCACISSENPARWKSLGPAASGSRIDFVRYQIPPSIVLNPASAHAPGTVEHLHVATGTVRVTVGDETAELSAGDSCSCRADAPHGVENPDPSAETLIYLIVERG